MLRPYTNQSCFLGLNQSHPIHPNQIPQRRQQVVRRIHPERAAAQADGAAVLISFLITVLAPLAPPFYEQRRRSGVRGTQRGNRAGGLRLGAARRRPAQRHADRSTGPQVVETACVIDDERRLLLTLIARDVSTAD